MRNSSMPSRCIFRKSIPDSITTTGVASGYRTLSIHDLDGSVTGIPDSHIMLNDGENDSVVTDDTCAIHPTWNASVCASGQLP